MYIRKHVNGETIEEKNVIVCGNVTPHDQYFNDMVEVRDTFDIVDGLLFVTINAGELSSEGYDYGEWGVDGNFFANFSIDGKDYTITKYMGNGSLTVLNESVNGTLTHVYHIERDHKGDFIENRTYAMAS